MPSIPAAGGRGALEPAAAQQQIQRRDTQQDDQAEQIVHCGAHGGTPALGDAGGGLEGPAGEAVDQGIGQILEVIVWDLVGGVQLQLEQPQVLLGRGRDQGTLHREPQGVRSGLDQ